jgi:hypothetical protein
MAKKIVKLTRVSSKKTGKYELRKEHIQYDDGTTEDRLACYDFSGKYIGSPREAERILNAPAPVPATPAPSYPRPSQQYHPKQGEKKVVK